MNTVRNYLLVSVFWNSWEQMRTNRGGTNEPNGFRAGVEHLIENDFCLHLCGYKGHHKKRRNEVTSASLFFRPRNCVLWHRNSLLERLAFFMAAPCGEFNAKINPFWRPKHPSHE